MTMQSWCHRLSLAFKRHILKPTRKKLFIICPTMNSELLSAQFLQTLPRYFLYGAFLCTLWMAMWALFPVSSDKEIVTLALSSNEIIKAVYKYTRENSDGTVDLVLNVPKGGESLLRLNNFQIDTPGDLRGENGTTESPVTQTPRPLKGRSMYPISLDADYVINSVHVCPTGQQVDYLIIVHSATAYFVRRRTIRETYAGKGVFGHLYQRVVFLLGTTADPLVTKLIQEEAFLYRDIVQGQFLDSYHNLTHKGVLGYRWITQHCPQAKLIVKIDDDVFINPFKLVTEVLPKYVNKTRHISCHVRPGGTSPILRGRGKWQVHDDEFRSQKFYPFDYCNGYFVILTPDLIRPMLNAARLNPFFWIDDVYLFGILPATVGSVKFVNIKYILTMTFNIGKKCFQEMGAQCKYLAVSQWNPDQPDTMWYLVLSNLTDSVKRELHVFDLSKPS